MPRTNTRKKPTSAAPVACEVVSHQPAKAPRKVLDPVAAFNIFNAAADEIPLPSEVAAPIIGKTSIAAMEKLRCIGGGPEFIKIGRNVFYKAGALRQYLRSLESHTVTQ
ncbi:hypothetical protein SAMN02949497_3957 [Methylomagnum ishizawai]|uniref:Helix-turn-helix domain-containing protein n=1 Tax=Methylomagnum ishizawai TaxID=1760988 RepID=A0A1Y6D1U2_9GAMM|nr:hypothetical protein [Methylomagnum ishizawai]SMF96556.1 hypothetical protein SAMN02949497_3957 [Methylomagnum ishizawai]